MTDVVTVFNFSGVPLDELPVLVSRGESLTRDVSADKGFFSIPSRHTKANLRNLKNGNIIYVQSSENGIRPYAALINQPPPNGTEIIDGELSMKLRSAEYIFGTRYTSSKDVLTGTAGDIAKQLIKLARREGFIPVSEDMSQIDSGGPVIGPLEYNDANIYEALNNLAESNDAYWGLNPAVDRTNRLVLIPRWQQKRTREFSVPLSTFGSNRNLTVSSICDVGEIYNHVKAYARTESWDKPIEYEETDQESVGYYGNTYSLVIPALEESTQTGLIPIVKSALQKYAFPQLQIDGVIRPGPFPRVGDVCTVYLSDYGALITARRGAIVKMTIETTFYTPLDNGLAVRLKEVI